MSAPCFKCEKRCAGCHATCEDYKDYHEERTRSCDEQLRQSIARGYFIDNCHKVAKMKRRRSR